MPLTVEDLRARLAGVLDLAADDPTVDATSRWQTILVDSLASANGAVNQWLTWRGFTPAQIALWVDRDVFVADIGLYWCLVKGAGLHDYDDTFVNKLDRRAELADYLILDAAGELIELEDVADTIVGHGKNKAESAFVKNVETGEFKAW